MSVMEDYNRQDKIYKDHFYVMVFDKDKESLENTVNGMMNTLVNAVTPLYTQRLYGRDLAVF